MARKRRPIPPRPNKGQIRAASQNKAAQNSQSKLSTLRAEKKAARKDYRQQLGSVQGASQMLMDALDYNRADLRQMGLKGQFLQSTLGELQSRKGDAAAAVPFEQAALKQELRNTLSSINDQKQTELLSMEDNADAIYKRRLARERAQRQKVIKNQRTRIKDQRSAGDKDKSDLRNANLNTQIVWEAIVSAARTDTKGLTDADKAQVEKARRLALGVRQGDEAAILKFIQNVAKQEATDPIAARKAVQKFLPTIHRPFEKASSFIHGG